MSSHYKSAISLGQHEMRLIVSALVLNRRRTPRTSTGQPGAFAAPAFSHIRVRGAGRQENRNDNNSLRRDIDTDDLLGCSYNEESFRAVAKGSFLRFSVASQMIWSRGRRGKFFRPVRKDQASGIRFGATRPDANVAPYFFLVVFFFFLAAFFFAITQSPPF